MSVRTSPGLRAAPTPSALARLPSSMRVRLFTQLRLNPQQRSACCAPGNVAVRACPGSGKTRLIAARLANEMLRWRPGSGGIATMTYTNVAADEIREALRDEMGLEVGYPHFLGTIDSFFDKHVFLPHAHRLIGRGKKGKIRLLVGEPAWARGAYPVLLGGRHEFNAVNALRLPDGTCVLKSRIPGRQDQCAKCRTRADKSPRPDRDYNCGKLKMAYDGFATHDDAMFWSLEILRRFNDVLVRLARRFSVLLVDELQDTKPTQMEALKLIRDTGHCRFFVAFDPDQAIYEYAQARPEACSCFAQGIFNQRPVSCTFRSTQEICNAVHPFSTLRLPANSKAQHRAQTDSCFVLKYQDVGSALRQFTDLVGKRDLNPLKSAILVRNNDNVDEVKKASRPEKLRNAGALARSLLTLYPLLARGDRRQAHERMIDALVSCEIAAHPSASDRTTRRLQERDLDGRCGQVLGQLLPLADSCYSDWTKRIRALLAETFCVADISSQILRRPESAKQNPTIRELLPELQATPVHTDVPVSTVHGVKGKNLEGVMLLTMMKKRYSSEWLDAPKEATGFWPEERRVAYVAMTRAEKLLVVAIPAGAPKAVFEHPDLAGFAPLDAKPT